MFKTVETGSAWKKKVRGGAQCSMRWWVNQLTISLEYNYQSIVEALGSTLEATMVWENDYMILNYYFQFIVLLNDNFYELLISSQSTRSCRTGSFKRSMQI